MMYAIIILFLLSIACSLIYTLLIIAEPKNRSEMGIRLHGDE